MPLVLLIGIPLGQKIDFKCFTAAISCIRFGNSSQPLLHVLYNVLHVHEVASPTQCVVLCTSARMAGLLLVTCLCVVGSLHC